MASICQWMNTLKGKDLLILSLPNVAKGKFRPNFQISFSKIVRNKIASCESTGRELSFEWWHHRISSTDSKVRVTSQNSIKQSGSERVNSFKSSSRVLFLIILNSWLQLLCLRLESHRCRTIQLNLSSSIFLCGCFNAVQGGSNH